MSAVHPLPSRRGRRAGLTLADPGTELADDFRLPQLPAQSQETHQLVLRMVGYVLLVFYLVGAFFSGWMTIALLAFKTKR